MSQSEVCIERNTNMFIFRDGKCHMLRAVLNTATTGKQEVVIDNCDDIRLTVKEAASFLGAAGEMLLQSDGDFEKWDILKRVPERVNPE